MATTTDKAAARRTRLNNMYFVQSTKLEYGANQEVVEPVGHGWSACGDGGITQTMFTQAAAPVEVRKLTNLYCTDKD